MKTKIFFALLLSFIFCLLSSQVPQGFNYQAIARDAVSGIPIKDPIDVKIAILSNDSPEEVIWEELHENIDPDNNGMFSIVVGTGDRESGLASFSDIDWTVTPKYIRTSFYHDGSWKNMGSARLWSVPYAMVADSPGGPLKKLAVIGETDDHEEALFEVKNKDGQTVFAVYNEGVRIYVSDGDKKGPKGGFAIGGFGTQKQEEQNYFFVSGDSIRAYIDSTSAKGVKGGFAIGSFDKTKAGGREFLRVTYDSVRIYLDNSSEEKGAKGGFAIGGFGYTKSDMDEYLRVTTDSVKVSKGLLIPRLTTEERDNLPYDPGEALIIFNMTESCMQIFKNDVWSNIWCFNCAPSFIIQPVDQAKCSGETAVFFVSATGTSLSYQWEESSDNGISWNSVVNGGTSPLISGANEYTLVLSNVPVEYNGYRYRCHVAGSCLPDAMSNVVALNVGPVDPEIQVQPGDQVLSAECGADFSIVVPGYGLTYQWQESMDGGSSWSDLADGGTAPMYSGTASATLSLANVPASHGGYKYRCVIGNSCGPGLTSDAAELIPAPAPVITKQPANKTVYAGLLEMSTYFRIASADEAISYQWYESTDGGATWNIINDGGVNPAYSGSLTDSLCLKNIPVTYNNYRYRCVVSHYCRNDAISNPAVLMVITPEATVTDYDGNEYNTIGINTQLWMAENLKTTHLRNGTAIPHVPDNTEWLNLGNTGSPGYCWYDNDEGNKDTYGALYNWFTAANSQICPVGWRVPENKDWDLLYDYLYNLDFPLSRPGGMLKEEGTLHWEAPNSYASNETGFTALPGGFREYNSGNFGALGYNAYIWSRTYVCYVRMGFDSGDFERLNDRMRMEGMSIRCIKND